MIMYHCVTLVVQLPFNISSLLPLYIYDFHPWRLCMFDRISTALVMKFDLMLVSRRHGNIPRIMKHENEPYMYC